MIEPVYLFEAGETAHSPLFILVHGRAGNVRIMSGISRSLPLGSARLFIQAPVPDPIGGFSWWLLEDPNADPWQASFALDRILGEILPQLGIEPRITAGIGFSQGGGVVRSPEPVPSGAVPDVFIAHGSDDTVVTIDEAEKGARYLTTELDWPTTMVVDSVGHKVGVQGMRGLKEWAMRMVME
jgi:predicted esterase